MATGEVHVVGVKAEVNGRFPQLLVHQVKVHFRKAVYRSAVFLQGVFNQLIDVVIDLPTQVSVVVVFGHRYTVFEGGFTVGIEIAGEVSGVFNVAYHVKICSVSDLFGHFIKVVIVEKPTFLLLLNRHRVIRGGSCAHPAFEDLVLKNEVRKDPLEFSERT